MRRTRTLRWTREVVELRRRWRAWRRSRWGRRIARSCRWRHFPFERNQGRDCGRDRDGDSGGALRNIRFHSVWYVVNLLGGAGVGTWTNPTMEQLTHFRLSAFITANIIQGATTLLVGFCTERFCRCGRSGRFCWAEFSRRCVDGPAAQRAGNCESVSAADIDWWSFAAAQVIFGLVAGYTVTKLGKIERLAAGADGGAAGSGVAGIDGGPTAARRRAEAMSGGGMLTAGCGVAGGCWARGMRLAGAAEGRA